ncbi:isoflavone reductase family protein [Metarhizium acridum CQMa 102]|uniref:Isoflavone reductase family protein n=1 Tax=Metarhizium acridum (strain CQMa 102) TaxID=655827 RepID=E9EDH2_METAQ|nr:isoflavone reductase family protein [Metarhizium acridum CQMa 102]EFY86036.1 isoflavone reductase family protein [Metarhizium acridum CQMa 102]
MQTGNNGKPLLDVVAASEKFKITLLVRKPPENYIDIVPDSVTVKQVDFQSHASLVAAFRGIDAVVSVVAFGPQSDIDVVEIGMINAAIEAGVKFFIPSEWAPDSAGANVTEDPWIGRSLRPNAVLAPKRAVHNYLMARAAQNQIAFAVVYTGVIIPTSLAVGLIAFDFQNRTAVLPDHGLPPFSATTLATTGSAVVAVLSAAFSTGVKNRFLHISDFTTSLAEILTMIETLDGVGWKRKNIAAREHTIYSMAAVDAGTFGRTQFSGALISPFFGGVPPWQHQDNELLGLGQEKSLTEEVTIVLEASRTNR